MSYTIDLTNRGAVVAGAASSLSRHVADVLAAAGARVAVVADVTDSDSVRGGLRTAAGALGGLDILVNTAAAGLSRPVLDHTEEDWDRLLDTNLKGAFLVAREGARLMREQGRGGTIVNVASILGLRVAETAAAEAASKAALVQLTQALALEWARHGIRVNALAPGFLESGETPGLPAGEAGQAMLRRVPQRRFGRLADLDGPLLLLCSEASAYMTGAVVPVDGGHLVSTL